MLNGGKREKTIMTTQGDLTFNRTILRTTKTDEENPDIVNKKEFVTLDEFFEILKLRFKMTKNMMNKLAFWAEVLPHAFCVRTSIAGSYREAQNTLRDELGIYVSNETIRNVGMYVGGLVHDHNTEQAESIERTLDKIPKTPSKEGVLYGMMDGSMLNTLEEFDEKYESVSRKRKP